MSCKICGRGSCASWMHSAEQQEAWSLVESMDDRQLKSEVVDLRGEVAALKAEIADEAIALRDMMSERDAAEAELAGIRALADRRNERDHSQDTTHQLVAALDQALDIAQAELAQFRELAAERARMADLVADLNDACITLESAKNDCDDYAMQNTAFKLMAVSNVLLQYIPNAAMKEETK